MSWLPLPLFAILLQSGDVIGEAISNGGLIADPASYSGFLGMIAQLFLYSISFFGDFFSGNYGLAIIITAIVMRVMLLPLTKKQIMGMKDMQVLQPVMKEIQRYYPDKKDQSAKTMELYSKYKINPLAGCLPMIVQMPILFGVYRALYDPFFAGKDFLGIQLLFPVNVTSARSFGAGPELMDLVDITVAKFDLMSHIVAIPQNIPLLGGGFWYLPGLVLVVLYVASSLFMQKVMRKVNAPDPAFAEAFKAEMKTPEVDEKPDLATQMQKQMGMMNFVIIIFAFIFSAGALLYFIVQNLLMVAEYSTIPKMGGGPKTFDVKELKAFIKQAPKPVGQPNDKIKGDIRGGIGEVAGANGAGGNSETNREGEAGAELEEVQAAKVISRPRKKRRKRK